MIDAPGGFKRTRDTRQTFTRLLYYGRMKKLLTYDNVRVVKTLAVMLMTTAMYLHIIKHQPRWGMILFFVSLVLYIISLLLLKLRKKLNIS